MNAVVNSIVAPPKWSTAGTSWRWATSPARPVPQPGPAAPSAVSGGSETAAAEGCGPGNTTFVDASTEELGCSVAEALGGADPTDDPVGTLAVQAAPTVAAIAVMRAR
jgi:hypothetical protein